MEPHHRRLLQKHRVALVQEMDLTFVFDALVQRNLFDPADYEDFEAQGKSRRKINQLFLTALERRGPTAFGAFVDSLREHKHGLLANLLDPASAPQYPAPIDARPSRVVDNPVDSISGPQGDFKTEPMETQPSKSVIASPTEDLPQAAWPANTPADLSKQEMHMAPQTRSHQDDSDVDEVYRMRSKPRGIAVVINNKHFRTMNTRKGTDIDGKNLCHVFEELGFNTIYKTDQTGEQMQQILRDAASHNHQSFDCFILAILSHGVEGAIYGVDERIVKIEHITSYFEGGRCPTLAGKPKLFFLQACRGERFDGGHEAVDSKAVAPSQAQPAEESEPEAPMSEEELLQRVLDRAVEDGIDASNAIRSKLPSQSDMLLAFATVPGFVSWRNSERGSWFVQALCEVFLENAPKEDLLSMMTKVNNKVARAFESSSGRNKQIPAPVTMLRKKLFFNPGR